MHMAVAAGIQPTDALLLLTPGETFDIFGLWARQHGLKRGGD